MKSAFSSKVFRSAYFAPISRSFLSFGEDQYIRYPYQKLLARLATALPISPKPIMPIVLPDTSRPLKNKGAHPSKPCVRDNLSPSTMRRATAKTSPKVNSKS